MDLPLEKVSKITSASLTNVQVQFLLIPRHFTLYMQYWWQKVLEIMAQKVHFLHFFARYFARCNWNVTPLGRSIIFPTPVEQSILFGITWLAWAPKQSIALVEVAGCIVDK